MYMNVWQQAGALGQSWHECVQARSTAMTQMRALEQSDVPFVWRGAQYAGLSTMSAGEQNTLYNGIRFEGERVEPVLAVRRVLS